MSMAMLLNAATAADARHKQLLHHTRGRIPIHSLLCTPDSTPRPELPVSTSCTSVLGKRKLVPTSSLVAAEAVSTPPSHRRPSHESVSTRDCWSSDGYSSESSPTVAQQSMSPMRRRRNSYDDPVADWRPSSPLGVARNAPRRRWKEDEDALLILVVREHGPGRWNRLAEQFPGRNGRQVRLRWMNHLQPSLDKREWRKEEDDVLLQAHATLGNKWALIAMKLNGRTDNSVKNRYKSLMRRQQREIRSRTPSR